MDELTEQEKHLLKFLRMFGGVFAYPDNPDNSQQHLLSICRQLEKRKYATHELYGSLMFFYAVEQDDGQDD